MTPSTIETAARRRLNAVSSSFWSQAEIIEDCLYFALNDLITRTKCYETTATTTSTASTADYAFPTDAIEIKQVTYDGQKLEVMDQRQYFSLNLAGTSSPVGRPTHYMIWGETVTLFPTPDTSALTIKFWFVSNPGTIAVASTVPVPEQFHPRLVNGVAYYMLLKETDDPRIPVFENRWFNVDLPWCEHEWKMRKYADKFPKVKLEENVLTNDTGVV